MRLCAAILLLGAAAPAAAQLPVVDDFERPADWSAVPGEGVDLTIGGGPGREGAALRLDFDFHGRAGYAVAHRKVDLTLPENYELAFWIRGPAPSNTLEFKLIDSSGANVWWSVRRNFTPGEEWVRIAIPRRHISFAWGPAGGGELRRVAAIEVAITAGTGGKGTVWLDELTLEPREPVRDYTSRPRAAASGTEAGSAPDNAIDGDSTTAWRAGSDAAPAVLSIDFGHVRVFGGLILRWTGVGPRATIAEISADGRQWRLLDSLPLAGPRDYLRLPEAEARHLRLSFTGVPSAGFALAEVDVQPAEWSASAVPMLEAIAADAARGSYPRYLLGQQSYWTVVGSAEDTSEALVSEDGAVEITPGGPSLEPFVFANGRLLSWDDAQITHSLAGGDLPIPSVRLDWGDLELEITAAARPEEPVGPVTVRYRLVSRRARAGESPALLVALRPFQVNPPWQFLGVPGGPAAVGSIEMRAGWIVVNGDSLVRLVSPPTRAGALPFVNGDIVARGTAVNWRAQAHDADSLASAMIVWASELGAVDSVDTFLMLPLGGGARTAGIKPVPDDGGERTGAAVDSAVRAWRARLGGLTLRGPPAVDSIARAMTSSLGYILVNRDGPAIQPGSRSYARSWIRDGALTSTALLRLGHFRTVRDFIDWFVPFQYPSGRAPCCVDRRGADPVPEHDSTGELIYLIAEYVRLSGDTAAARRLWPVVDRGARFLDSLRHERLTDVYREPDSLVFLGLLPPSISHEGYSARPVHSYWDDFFALRGFKDAAWLAAATGQPDAARRWNRVAIDFRRDFFASIELVRRRRGLAFIPGSADLGDFDATSTSIALDPVGEEATLPRDALEATFARYYAEAMARRDTLAVWEAYTPYEWRNVGALVRLGERDRALALFRLLFGDRRPLAWNQWGEVVWRERRLDRFIGDMPHTWVASDFIRSALDLFAYERTSDSSLVLLAGTRAEWLEGPGISLEGLRTAHGALAISASRSGAVLAVRVALDGPVPAGGIVIVPPGVAPRGATVGGRRLQAEADGTFRVRRPRVEVRFRY